MDNYYKMTLVMEKPTNFAEMASTGALKFSFSTSSMNSNKAKAWSDETSLHAVNVPGASTRKLSSLETATGDKLEGINSGLSTNSTVEGSSASIQTAHTEMECAMKGEVSMTVDHRPSEQGFAVARLCFEVFLAALDYNTKGFLERVVANHSLLEEIMIDLFTLLAAR